MRLPAFDYHAPESIEEVFALLSQHGDTMKLMAGGTELLPRMRAGKLHCEQMVSLRRVEGLNRLEFDKSPGLRIGATTTLTDVMDFEAVREHYPALSAAIRTLATVQVRNKATVAGNLCNASPCADTATPLLAYGARIVIASEQGQREIDLEQFFTGPGKTALAGREILEEIRVPTPPNDLQSIFLKFSPRSKVDIAAVNLSIALRLEKKTARDVAIFLGTVAPTPMRATKAQKALEGKPLSTESIAKSSEAASKECKPITDFRLTKEYKRHLVRVLTRHALDTLGAVR